MPRTSLPRAAARTRKYFNPCMPLMMKESDFRSLDTICRRDDFLFFLEQGRQRSFGKPESFDLNLPLRRCPAAATAGGARAWHQLFRQAEARTGHPIFGQPPTDTLGKMRRRFGGIIFLPGYACFTAGMLAGGLERPVPARIVGRLGGRAGRILQCRHVGARLARMRLQRERRCARRHQADNDGRCLDVHDPPHPKLSELGGNANRGCNNGIGGSTGHSSLCLQHA